MAVLRLIVSLTIIKLVSGINICGLDNYTSCDPFNATCVMKVQHPVYLKWFTNGRPEYFIDPIDVLSYKELEIPVDDGAYYLENVTVTGAADTKLSNYSFDRDSEKGFMNFTYAINLEVTSDCIYKEDSEGYRITRRHPFCAKIGHLEVEVVMPLKFVYRCDGTQYLLLDNEKITVTPKNYLIIKYGKPWCKDKKMFKLGITNTLGGLVARAINVCYRVLSTAADINTFLDFTTYNNKNKPTPKCEHSTVHKSHKSQSHNSKHKSFSSNKTTVHKT